MTGHRLIRVVLLVLLGFVAITAIAGGSVLVAGSLWPDSRTLLSPPTDLLEGSPFTSYLVPGIVLMIVVGGLHAAAFVLVVRRGPRALLVSVIGAYALVIWIVVQMTIIPFSPLQAAYLALGLAEIAVVLLALGVVTSALGAPQPPNASS